MVGLLVNISNHPTLPFKRKQEVTGFRVNWTNETVDVYLKLRHYTLNEDNSYGPEIISPSINNYESTLVAKGSRRVDPTDGMECVFGYLNIGTEEEQINQEVYRRIDNNQVVENHISQFAFFDYLIKNQPINVSQLLYNFIAIDDQLKGKWNN